MIIASISKLSGNIISKTEQILFRYSAFPGLHTWNTSPGREGRVLALSVLSNFLFLEEKLSIEYIIQQKNSRGTIEPRKQKVEFYEANSENFLIKSQAFENKFISQASRKKLSVKFWWNTSSSWKQNSKRDEFSWKSWIFEDKTRCQIIKENIENIKAIIWKKVSVSS